MWLHTGVTTPGVRGLFAEILTSLIKSAAWTWNVKSFRKTLVDAAPETAGSYGSSLPWVQ